MRTGEAAGHHGYYHATALYGSDEEFLSILVPFLEGGLQAGEPTVVALGEVNEKLVRAAMGSPAGLTFVGGVQHLRPANAVKTYRELLAEQMHRGAHQVRVVGEVPHPGVGMPWEWWARYEAAINHIYDDFPLWGLCPYDTRSTPDSVLADVLRTHPYTVTAVGAHLLNAGFEDPARFLADRHPDVDPLEAAPPAVEAVNPEPATARRHVVEVAKATDLDHSEVDDLVFAVSEVVTNGICHGKPPVHLRLWASHDRVLAKITDCGPGLENPFSGLLPTTDSATAGLGLWLAHRMCSHVSLVNTDEGFTVRLTAGNPYLA
jgi:anti-sigma regulatory factor (Ser/Thr protein kinase)